MAIDDVKKCPYRDSGGAREGASRAQTAAAEAAPAAMPNIAAAAAAAATQNIAAAAAQGSREIPPAAAQNIAAPAQDERRTLVLTGASPAHEPTGIMRQENHAAPAASAQNIASAQDERKTLVLTGASRGIGHATVKRFSRAGWRVITCSRQSFSPQECPWAEGEGDHIRVDLADAEDVGRAISEIRRRLESNGSRLHALVNNAGISPKGEGGKRLNSLETNMQIWRAVFQVNFYAPIMLARGLFAELTAAKGAIVNVTSIAGGRVHPFAGTAYATSKAALAALTREMASDFGPHGIRVNAIAPGEIATAILSPGTEKMAEHLPLRRLGLPEEVADTIYYLCGDEASYVTGSEIHINGGQHV